MCGDFTLRVIELPPKYKLNNTTTVAVAEYIRQIAPDLSDPAGLRAAARAALFGATCPVFGGPTVRAGSGCCPRPSVIRPVVCV